MGDSPISAKDFGASFKTFMEQMSRESPADEPFFRRRLREHFGADPSKFSIVAHSTLRQPFGIASQPVKFDIRLSQSLRTLR